MGFDLAKLKISIQTQDPAKLVAWLPTCGREFSAICKKAVCTGSSTECHICCSRSACPWFLVFGQQLSSDPVALKRYQKPPLPFAFSFLHAGNSGVVECGLVIVGTAINHAALLGNAFADLCSSGHAPLPCKLAGIETQDLQGKNFPLRQDSADSTDYENLVVFSSDEITDSSGYGSSEILIRLLSPLRLLEEGRQSNRFEFGRFAGSIMRRVSSIAYYYCGYEFNSDFKALARQANEVICTDYQFRKGSCGSSASAGLCGYGSFIGDFDGLLPFLLLGSFLNAGKGAAYGMGKYEVML